jgi:hypothetical protein
VLAAAGKGGVLAAWAQQSGFTFPRDYALPLPRACQCCRGRDRDRWAAYHGRVRRGKLLRASEGLQELRLALKAREGRDHPQWDSLNTGAKG